MDGVRDADEVLLRPVVQVPLEPLPLGVARRDDARARAPDLLLDLLPRGDVETAEEVAKPVLGVVHHGRRPVDDEPLPVGRDVLVLDDPRRVVVPESDEVLLGARDVLAGDEELPERVARSTSPPGCPT